MKNLPSYEQFNKNYSLLESMDSELESSYLEFKNDLSIDESLITINEGAFGDSIKNWASKSILGSLGLSKVSYIDKARKAHLALQLDLLDRKDEYETKLEEYNEELDKLSPKVSEDKPKVEAIRKKIEEEKRIFDAYTKAQRLKIEKAKDIIEEIVGGNSRRRAYAEAGLAEDKIVMAEQEYEYAKNRSEESGDIDELTEKIKNLRKELEKKVERFKSSEEDRDEKHSEIKREKESVTDPISKRIIEKIKTAKPKGIIDIVEEIKKDIATYEAEYDRIQEEMKKKSKAGKMNPTIKAGFNKKLKIKKSEIEGRKKQLEILIGLGKDPLSIGRSLKNSKKSEEALAKIAEIKMEEEEK
jgi:hypothetical protein